uniref:Core-2/I-Branching enzyme n=1 Tax=Caenorhabditis tropicalis TaxID=1561998 RepID=A0A1I7T4P1_9PELO
MFNGDRKALARGSLFEFDESRIKISECEDFRTVFGFFETARSEEEKEFPLAYGMLIHDNFIQLTLLLSAIYQPQNQFCLAVDGNSTKEFVEQVALLASCYPNIHYFITDKIKWCGYEILTSVFQCVDYLSRLPSDWKYFQYLSGVDAPLKSNLEMVRIFKAFNGSFNAEISPFEYYRLNRKLKVLSQIEFLRGTTCADESLWATIAGNPDKLAMPGGFNAAKWLRKHRGANSDYYVSRYQQYVNRPPAKCQGMEGFRKTGITGEPLEIERSVREQNCSA